MRKTRSFDRATSTPLKSQIIGRGEEESFFFFFFFFFSLFCIFSRTHDLTTVFWSRLFPNNCKSERDELETLCDAASRKKDDDDDARVEGNDDHHHKRRRA